MGKGLATVVQIFTADDFIERAFWPVGMVMDDPFQRGQVNVD